MNHTALGDGRAHGDGFWLLITVKLLKLAFLGWLAWASVLVIRQLTGLAPPNDPVPAVRPTAVVQAPATVTSSIAKGIGSPFAGTVERLDVRRGQGVTRGQLLFRMDVGPLRQRITQLEEAARVASAEALAARVERDDALVGISAMLSDAKTQLARARRVPGATLVAVGAGDFETLTETKDRVAFLTAWHRERRLEWDRRIAAASSRKRQAAAEAARLRRLIRQAKRYSPINGVVTSIRAAAGDWVKGATPVVRVDDPHGYRIVSLVPNRTNAVPQVGAELRVLSGERQLRTRVSRVMPGWDRELFSTWVWMVPARPAAFTPGQRLEAVLTPQTQVDVRTTPQPERSPS